MAIYKRTSVLHQKWRLCIYELAVRDPLHSPHLLLHIRGQSEDEVMLSRAFAQFMGCSAILEILWC